MIRSRRQLLSEIPSFAASPEATPGDALEALHEETVAAAVNKAAGRDGAYRMTLLRIAGLALTALVVFDRERAARLRQGIG